MKKVYIKKVFKYDPTFNGKYSKYQGYCYITNQTKSPSIEETEFKSRVKYTKVFSSTLKRGKDSAMLYISSPIYLEALNEIKFNLRKLLSEEEFYEYKSNMVRERFVEAFIKDSLLESRKSIKLRMDKVIAIAEDLEDGNYLFISHSFFMKLLQIYLKHKELFDEPQILRKYLKIQKKTFEFGKGFRY